MKSNNVTNPETKVSEKARELVRKLPLSLEYEGQNAEDAADVAGRLIQAELRELLEAGRKEQAIVKAHEDEIFRAEWEQHEQNAAILSKWEPK